jgi:hypothetical protein
MDAIQIAEAYFPGSLSVEDTLRKVGATIEKLGFNDENTVLALSVSPNVVHRDGDYVTADAIIPHAGRAYHVGGLAGIPFRTRSIAAMCRSVPDDGHCVVFMAPHLGISDKNILGKSFDDQGMSEEDACVATNALAHCLDGKPVPDLSESTVESFQMDYIINEVSRRVDHLRSIAGQNARQAELAQQMWDIAKLQLENQLEKLDLGGKDTKLVVFTGVRINMPASYSDYFYPMSFELHLKNGIVLDLFEETFRHTAPAEFRDRPSAALVDVSTCPQCQYEADDEEDGVDGNGLGRGPANGTGGWKDYLSPRKWSVGAVVGSAVLLTAQVLTSYPVMKSMELQRHSTQGY